MIKIENVVLPSPEQLETIIMGMRNPKNSWDRSDSRSCSFCRDEGENPGFCDDGLYDDTVVVSKKDGSCFEVGEKDHGLMKRLANGGPVHAKYRRMIPVYVTITAPLYWWKEFDTYKVGTVSNSCSTMHKISDKEFTLDDFSHEHLAQEGDKSVIDIRSRSLDGDILYDWMGSLLVVIKALNGAREKYLKTKEKFYWWQMIQLLPSSYNQKRTIMLNYEVLANIYKYRKDHKLDEWKDFLKWIESLPMAEGVIYKVKEKNEKV